MLVEVELTDNAMSTDNPEIIKSSEANDGRKQDALWQKQQIKSFTAWVNSHLTKKSLSINDISIDLCDGIKLMKLVEIISTDALPPPEKGRMKLHKIQNINCALEKIKLKGVNVTGISAEEIYDSNLKLILGLIWMLILKFQISEISVEEMSARDGLLLWCQKKTAGYSGCNVQNFHTSWQSGDAFCALIHRHRPELLDFNTIPENPKDKLNLAFTVAEKSLGIPQMLDADDMVKSLRPDELSVITYVAAYYHCFAGSNKAEVAARRVEAVLDFEKSMRNMILEYELRSSSLLEWIFEKSTFMSKHVPFRSLNVLQSAIQNFQKYKNEEKLPKSDEKISLEAHYSSLQNLLRVNHRPAYHPEEGQLVSKIQESWNSLTNIEKEYDLFMTEEKDRLEKLERLAKRFKTKVTVHSKWVDSQVPVETIGDDFVSVMVQIQQHEAYQTQIEGHSNRVSDLEQIFNELTEGNYEQLDSIKSSYDQTIASWNKLNDNFKKRKEILEDALEHQKKIDSIKLYFAKTANSLNSWNEGMNEDLLEEISTNSMEDVVKEESALAKIITKISDKSKEYEELISLANDMKNMNIKSNNYTTLTIDAVLAERDEINELAKSREQKLKDEKKRQEQCESLRVQFAKPANKIGQEMDAMYIKISALQTGILEEQLKQMNDYLSIVERFKPELEKCNEISKKMNENSVFNNHLSSYSMTELTQMYDQLNSSVRKNIRTIQNQIELRDTSGISEDQMKEYKETFNRFSNAHRGLLNKNEFRSAIMGVGFDLGEGDTKLDLLWDQYGVNDGGVTLESFVDMFSKELKDDSSVTQLMESFKILAGDKDYVTEADLRKELKKDTADYALSRLRPHPTIKNAYFYKEFADNLFSKQ